MKLIKKPRGAGKTQALLRWLDADSNRILVVPTAQDVRNIHNCVSGYRGRIYAVSGTSLVGLRLGIEIAVDDVDRLLDFQKVGQRPQDVEQALTILLGYRPSIATMTIRSK